MATQIQFRRGTRTQHSSFTGATGEVTVNTTDISLHVHDGISAGGVQLARSDLQNVTGISTFTSTNLNATTLNVSGTGSIAVGIITNLRGTNLNYTGIATANSISIGATQVISNERQLQNIASLDATTTATIESAIANAPNTLIDLNVTGFSTLSSVSVGNISLSGIITGLNVPGISTLSSIDATNINSSGVSTFVSLRSTNINASGISTALDFNATSDINLKTNVIPITNSIEKIVKITGVTFNWKESQKPSIGVIAQNVEEVFPELVSEGETKTVNYNGLVGALIEAVKEQQKQIDILKEEIENLKVK